jgi:hypothetical protein
MHTYLWSFWLRNVDSIFGGALRVTMLLDVLAKREMWLQNQGLPLNFQMRGGQGLERERFLQHCKAEFHAAPLQQWIQARDAQISSQKIRQGMHSRWAREMQRRLGSKALWEVVSFTGNLPGNLPVYFLIQAIGPPQPPQPPQPDVQEPDSPDDDPQTSPPVIEEEVIQPPVHVLPQIINVGDPQPHVQEPDSRDRSRSPDDPQTGPPVIEEEVIQPDWF